MSINRMKRTPTMLELNDISCGPSSARLPGFSRPSSAPLESLMLAISNDSTDPFVIRSSHKYLQTFSENDHRPDTAVRRYTSTAIMTPFQDQTSHLINNNTPVLSSHLPVPPCNTDVSIISSKSRFPPSIRKAISGIILMLIAAVSSVATTQFAKSSLTNSNFYAPYLLTWLSINCMTLSYPIFSGSALISQCLRLKSRKTNRILFHEAKLLFGTGSLISYSVLRRMLMFGALWILSNYTYLQSLSYLSATETASVFLTHPAFIYLISWTYFHDVFISTRIISVLLSLIGIVLMAHATGIGTSNFVGIVSAVVSSSMASIFQVVFKSSFGEPTLNQASLFFTLLGLTNFLFNFPLTFILYMTSAEKINWIGAPWHYICASAALSLICNFLTTNIGTFGNENSIFILIGLFVSIPMNAIVDFVMRNYVFGTFQLIGSVCVFTSCILLLIPNDFVHRLSRNLIKSDFV